VKLVYVFLGGSAKGSSVQNKILCQIAELRNSGIDAKGWFFSPSIEHEIFLDEHVKIIPLTPFKPSQKYFQNFSINQDYYRQINGYLKAKQNEFDQVFLRHGSSGPEYFKLLLAFKDRLNLFIPSNSIAENFKEKQYASKTGIGSFLFRWWEFYKYFYVLEKELIKSFLPQLKAVIVFTEEFGRILNSQARNKIRIIYNRDGADCRNVPVRIPNTQENGKVELLFMKGSSMQQPWSGLDRLIKSIEDNGADRFKLYITGNVIDEGIYKKPFVKLTGRLSEEDLQNLVNQVDLGVSNLANYMIKFNETTNLKSRDYFARGLPFVQANSMPDVEGTEGDKYYLQLSNDDSIIPMQDIYEFAHKIRKDSEHTKNMRAFAESTLDWKVTVAELAAELKK
jgi:hypothetical protein